jgi:hypothetical protein
MTKDGRPSRINDIRYFFGDRFNYLDGHRDAVAYGRRVAWFLNGEAFSLGSHPALYILFMPTLGLGEVCVTDDGAEWWHRYTHVGVSPQFPNGDDTTKIVAQGTVAALKTIRPDLAATVDRADDIVRANGEELFFPLKVHRTQKYVLTISFNIAVWPRPSQLLATLTIESEGSYLEAEPHPIQIFTDAFDLCGQVRLLQKHARVLPNESVSATLASLRHGGPLTFTIDDFKPAPTRVYSKLVKRRG